MIDIYVFERKKRAQKAVLRSKLRAEPAKPIGRTLSRAPFRAAKKVLDFNTVSHLIIYPKGEIPL